MNTTVRTSASDVAKYILSLSDEDSGELISNLKLQKLLYYVQGFSLAITGKPMFREAIKAWEHGPVVPQVWHEYRDCLSGAIPVPMDVPFDSFSAEQKELLDEVYSVYGQFSAWKLRNMTHDEPPWTETAKNEEIKHGKLKSFFRTKITDGEGKE